MNKVKIYERIKSVFLRNECFRNILQKIRKRAIYYKLSVFIDDIVSITANEIAAADYI
jgi:hypothetical protein